jgi:ABC-2 type transport system ATP-binding protein
MTFILEVRNISKSFDSRKVLHSLTLILESKKIIGLIGKSGCGKSTLIKILVGYQQPTSGVILCNGEDVTQEFHTIKQQVGYVSQDGSYYEKLTVFENLRYYCNLYNVPRKQRAARINNILHAVDLTRSKHVLVSNISGGMKRRLDFGLALVHRPKVVILDEPTTGLDPLLVENFWNIVHDVVKKENMAVLVSSHMLEEIQSHCTHVAIMHAGTIVKNIFVEKSTNLRKLFKEHTRD